jgi:hypothetical protein
VSEGLPTQEWRLKVRRGWALDVVLME